MLLECFTVELTSWHTDLLPFYHKVKTAKTVSNGVNTKDAVHLASSCAIVSIEGLTYDRVQMEVLAALLINPA